MKIQTYELKFKETLIMFFTYKAPFHSFMIFCLVPPLHA